MPLLINDRTADLLRRNNCQKIEQLASVTSFSVDLNQASALMSCCVSSIKQHELSFINR